jgi:hypothetical protein
MFFYYLYRLAGDLIRERGKKIVSLHLYICHIGVYINVILNEDATEYIHVHPANDHEAIFETQFSKAGTYKI